MPEGWIKIHRKINDWEWLDKPETFQLFIYLLVNANYEDKKWHGKIIKRGEIVVGREKLSKLLGVSEQSIRTSIKRLKSTNEITSKSTNKYTVISIINYDEYQQINQPINQQLTNKEPTTNHKQEYKNDKNINNISNPKSSKPFPYPLEREILYPILTLDKKIKLAQDFKTTISAIEKHWDLMLASKISNNKNHYNWIEAFRNWLGFKELPKSTEAILAERYNHGTN